MLFSLLGWKTNRCSMCWVMLGKQCHMEELLHTTFTVPTPMKGKLGDKPQVSITKLPVETMTKQPQTALCAMEKF